MGKLLQINPVIRRNTSTGKIMQEIGELAMKNGWESYIAYSGGRDGKDPSLCKSKIIPVGTKFSVAEHAVETRLLDRHGLASRLATRKFLEQIDELHPDIIQIHNIHGYFLNYKMLFDYLSKTDIKVVWTVHDCWLYTGHCYHYSSVGCPKWRTGCGNCPQKRSFPASWLLDRSAKNYRDKKTAFTSLAPGQLTIVTVSNWMKEEMADSFLGSLPFQVIHNGIDTETFKPASEKDMSDTRTAFGIDMDSHVLLGLASIWLKEKGLGDFMQLAKLLKSEEQIVLVGKMTAEQQELVEKTNASLVESQKRIITIPRTDNVTQLAALYSMADVFLNPTWQDNYPTVNMECQSCGTPLITYRTGGSIESHSAETGTVVEQGDVEGLRRAIDYYRNQDREQLRTICRTHALGNFSKEDRYKDYIDLYNGLIDA